MNKDIVRSLQTYFPALQDFRFSLQRFYRSMSNRVHEEDFDALKLFKPGTNATYLDIGTNRGEAIQSMLMRTADDVSIVGFEPNPLVFAKSNGAYGNHKRVKINNFGLGNEPLELTLFIPFYRQWMFDGLASFHYDQAADWLRTRIWHYQEKNLNIKKVVCKVRCLDELQLNPYFIKIDVQGFELNVLQGGVETLKKARPIILIESIGQDIMDFLQPMGYQFYKFETGKLILGEGKLNTFCITSERYQQMNQ
jgi:FkbM family methyltransferase